MTPLLLIRHGPTTWNEAGRIQGQTDTELSPAGRARVTTWRLPSAWREARWLASPLGRAQATAALLTDQPVAIEPRLMEMDWGAWAGRRLSELRAEAPVAMAENEARGLDFRPPGGESPREVATRLAEVAAELATAPRPVVAVAHRGLLRAALVLATGWDMRSKPLVRLSRDHALHLDCAPGGRLGLVAAVDLTAE